MHVARRDLLCLVNESRTGCPETIDLRPRAPVTSASLGDMKLVHRGSRLCFDKFRLLHTILGRLEAGLIGEMPLVGDPFS